MSKLEQLINELCPEGVEYIRLKECTEMKRGTSATKKTLSEGHIPVISGGKEPAFYCDTANRYGETITIAGSGAGAGYVQYWNEPIFVNDAFSIKGSKNLNTRYIYHYLLNIQEKIYYTKKGEGVPHVHISSIENFLIPIPPLPVQEEIVRVLDKFTELTAELTAEFTARKQQYEYYSESLLNFTEEYDCKKIKLKEISDIYLGLTATPKYTNSGVKFISAQNTSKDFLDLENVKYISEIDYAKATSNAKPKRGDILFTRVGSNLGHPVIIDTDEKLCIFVSLGFLRIKNKNIVSNSYLKHWMNTDLFWSQVRKKVFGAAKVNLNTGWLKEFELTLPPIDIQEKIVNHLDCFEKYFNFLHDNLSLEIETRQKQYEYYRDKLLTFKKKEAAENE